ncbi:MAG: hypothetical protein JJT96_07945 [Opitutales bacterium]|nr:hypothetical protein [Opitutales bacterium]
MNTPNLKRPAAFACLIIIHGLLLNAVPASRADTAIRYPADGGVIDVTNLPPGIHGGISAVPDNGLDDTAAIQAALDAFPNGNRIIYFPNGVYHISDTLTWPAGVPGATDFKRTIFEGETRDGVILRLFDESPGFTDAAAPKAMIFTGPSAPAQRFRNAVRNLTLDTGSGNPGAIGLHFSASNQGTVRDVTIRSGDGSGLVGLDLRGNENGPLMVRGLRVEGFDKGISMNAAINGIVMEDIHVEGQNIHGIDATGQILTIRRLTSVNSVPAIWHGDPNARDGAGGFGGIPRGGMLTLLDSTLTGTPGAEAFPAIWGQGFAFIRDVQTSGYLRAYQRSTLGGINTVNTPEITEYAPTPFLRLFDNAPLGSLRLPIEEIPEPARDPVETWVNVETFGAISGAADSTSAIQAAIDSGAGTVYFPGGKTFRIASDLFVRGSVNRFIGLEGRLESAPGTRIFFEEGTAPVVVMERFSGFPSIVHDATRTLVVRNIIGHGGLSTGSGDLFVEDVAIGGWQFLHPAQRAWFRQLNVETATVTNILNAGARVWILGLKTERDGIKIETTDGGFTEVLGAHIFDTGQPPPEMPLFRVENASATFAGVATSTFNSTNYQILVEEVRGGESRIQNIAPLPNRTSANGKVVGLFSARHPGEATPTTPLEAWRFRHGLPMDGSGTGANTFTPVPGGLPNFAAYALGLPPGSPATEGLLAQAFTLADGLRLSVRQPKNRRDIDLFVEASIDLTSWETVAASYLGTPFELLHPEGFLLQESLDPNGFRNILVTTQPNPIRFLRLRVTLPVQ